jgi:peptidoglycan/LPS O-acetylase OafA/YrhL
MAQNNRIGLLDSFRAIAIIMVIFFHFFSRWTNLYPYQDRYDFFRLGKFGVHFFFMISGFVIFFTLNKTKTLRQFWINRFIRLFPSMLFASVLTYIFFNLFDNIFLFPTSHYFKNILASITFLQPDLIASLIRHKIDLDYISGSYWSLWVEIQFYVLASLLYFFYQRKFYFCFFIVTGLLVVSNFLLSHIYVNSDVIVKLKALRSIFNLADALPFFCLGSIFYVFYENNLKQIKNSIWEKSIFLFFIFFLLFTNCQDFKKLILILFFIVMFLLMVYSPRRISFLNNKILNGIGVSSYFLYLIHENIGVFLIHNNGIEFSFLPFLAPIFYMAILIIFSVFFTKYIEERIILLLKKSGKF